MNSRSPHRRGFAIVASFIVLIFVGMFFVAVTGLIATDAHRTADAADDAQLHQLLHAAHVVVLQKAAGVPGDHLPPSSFDVPLPPEVSAASLHIDLADAVANVTATSGRHQIRETVTLAHADGRWSITALALNP